MSTISETAISYTSQGFSPIFEGISLFPLAARMLRAKLQAPCCRAVQPSPPSVH